MTGTSTVRPPLDDEPQDGGRRLDLTTVRSALALLREPLWTRLCLAVVVLSVAFVFLGRWQLHRHEAKVARNDLINANYDGAPVPLDTVLATPAAPLPTDREWTQVTVTGTYEPQHQILIRNRPLDGNFGYEIVVPLRLASGAALLVDRGWVPPGEHFVTPDVIPAAPTGQVTVVARLKPGEPAFGGQPPAGEEMSVELDRIAAVAGGPVYRGAYGVLAGETPAPPTAPSQLPRPDEDLGPHLAYAYQWWFGAVAGYVLIGVYAVREVHARQDAAADALAPSALAPSAAIGGGSEADGAGSEAGGTADGGPVPDVTPTIDGDDPVPVAPRTPPRSPWPWTRRRSGPTDEEWEDAASGG